jgi:hypothetical protein
MGGRRRLCRGCLFVTNADIGRPLRRIGSPAGFTLSLRLRHKKEKFDEKIVDGHRNTSGEAKGLRFRPKPFTLPSVVTTSSGMRFPGLVSFSGLEGRSAAD